MDELKAAFEGALSGHGQLVMLLGEPGIGKTRTAEELASVARRMGVHVLWGRCPEERGAPTYWPWVQAIRSYVLEQEPDTLRSQLDRGASDIGRIVPELQERLPGPVIPSPTKGPQHARFRLFEAITSFLERMSWKQPLLLVLDNLHWADPSSLRLLEFVTPELASARVLLLGTYRDVDVHRRHPLFHTLGELARQQLYQRVLLRGLSRDEVGQVMEDMGGVVLPDELVTTVHQHTEGNPLFVREVVRLLGEEGLLARDRLSDLKGWHFRLPDGIREVIGRRLDRLSRRCNEVLTIASVIGREFSIGLLSGLSQQPSDQLVEVLDEAVSARILEEVPAQIGRYQFCHSLIQQTLTAELSTTRKIRLHARIAETLEAVYGPDAQDHATELAYHLSEADVAGSYKLVVYSRLAGEKALADCAYEEALTHFQRALAARESTSVDSAGQYRSSTTGPDAETAELLFGLGRAQAATHQVQEAIKSLGSAFEYYSSTVDLEHVVAIAGHGYRGSLTPLMTEFRRRALSLLPPDSHDAGNLFASYGLSQGMAGDYQEANKAFSQAHAIARRERDTALETRTLAGAARVAGAHLHWQECLDHSRQAIEVSGHIDDLAKVRAHFCDGNALLQFGNLREASSHASASLSLAEKLGDRLWLTRACSLVYMMSYLSGDFQTARVFCDRALLMDPRDTQVLACAAQLEYQAGDISRCDYYIDQLLEGVLLAKSGPLEDSFAAVLIPLLASATNTSSRFNIACKAAQEVLSSPSATPDHIQRARTGLALLAVQRSDADLAAEQYSHLESCRAHTTNSGGVMIGRVLGLLAQTMSQPDLVISHLEDTLVFCRRAGYRLELAWTLYNYSAFLCERRRQERALPMLKEALSICTDLGICPLKEKVDFLFENVNANQTHAPKYPAGLTERQEQVLTLIARGKTNREVAKELGLSERTVERHTADIYAKIGARNRAEATAFALSQLATADS